MSLSRRAGGDVRKGGDEGGAGPPLPVGPLADIREHHRHLTNLAGLITQRSQVQILPPLREK